jgi:hypothetical protein
MPCVRPPRDLGVLMQRPCQQKKLSRLFSGESILRGFCGIPDTHRIRSDVVPLGAVRTDPRASQAMAQDLL